MNKNITLVTGLWDMGRGNLEGWAKRDFEYYKTRFFEFLETDVQMCIWIPKDLEEDVLRIRGDKPTKIFIKNLEDFKTWNPFFNKIQEIRNTDSWNNFAGWLGESPQATLEYYNPMMFTKMFMLNDSAIINPFNSDYLFWIDGGLTNTVNSGYFVKDKVLDNLESNAEYKGMDLDRLRIVNATVHKGTIVKRFTPRAMGRASPKNNVLTHVELVAQEV